jgi:hypothetical protein
MQTPATPEWTDCLGLDFLFFNFAFLSLDVTGEAADKIGCANKGDTLLGGAGISPADSEDGNIAESLVSMLPGAKGTNDTDSGT